MPRRFVSTTLTVAAVLIISVLVSVAPAAIGANKKSLPKGVNALVSIGGSNVTANGHYLGLSVEMAGLCNLLRADSSQQGVLENLFRNLGPVVLKVNGSGADYSTWDAQGKPVCGSRDSVLTQSEIQQFFAFVKRIKAEVVWGLPLARFNPSAAASEAKYVAAQAGKSLIGWILGNEPELYIKAGSRPSTWTFDQYYAQWLQTRTAVVAAVPHIGFVGPEECCTSDFFTGFAHDARGRVSALSYHLYAGAKTNETAAFLLGTEARRKARQRTTTLWNDDVKGAHVPLWATEASTFPDGGVPGVSDTYVAAPWLADLLFDVATLKVSQVDVQETFGGATYDPISPAPAVAPIYYGMLFYHDAVPAKAKFVTTYVTMSPSSNVTAYADRAHNGVLNLVLFNRGTQPATLRLRVDRNYAKSAEYTLTAPTVSSLSAVTLGGRQVSSNGGFAGPLTVKVALNGRNATVQVPAASAMCVSFHP